MRVKDVFYRRPLVKAFIALRGIVKRNDPCVNIVGASKHERRLWPDRF